jgi:hypothetical protein
VKLWKGRRVRLADLQEAEEAHHLECKTEGHHQVQEECNKEVHHQVIQVAHLQDIHQIEDHQDKVDHQGKEDHLQAIQQIEAHHLASKTEGQTHLEIID